MSCIHYKFKSSLEYDTLTFDGLHISLANLKKAIIEHKKLGKSGDFHLQITDAQTKQAYVVDSELIPRNASVIVTRVPIGGVSIKSKIVEEALKASAARQPLVSKQYAVSSVDKIIKPPGSDGQSEEDRILSMMQESAKDYDPVNYIKPKYPSGKPYKGYVCRRCGKPGHYIQNCTEQPPEGEKEPPFVKHSKRHTGIPREFLTLVNDSTLPGAKMIGQGYYAVPTIDKAAYEKGKKEKPPFVPQDEAQGPIESDKVPIPGELVCPLCRELLREAVVIPCCGASFCDECVRDALMASEDQKCPADGCGELDVAPNSLIPNKFLRTAVTNFLNDSGYAQIKKRVQDERENSPSLSSSRNNSPYMKSEDLSVPSPKKDLNRPTLPDITIPFDLVGLPPQVIQAKLRERDQEAQRAREPIIHNMDPNADRRRHSPASIPDRPDTPTTPIWDEDLFPDPPRLITENDDSADDRDSTPPPPPPPAPRTTASHMQPQAIRYVAAPHNAAGPRPPILGARPGMTPLLTTIVQPVQTPLTIRIVQPPMSVQTGIPPGTMPPVIQTAMPRQMAPRYALGPGGVPMGAGPGHLVPGMRPLQGQAVRGPPPQHMGYPPQQMPRYPPHMGQPRQMIPDLSRPPPGVTPLRPGGPQGPMSQPGGPLGQMQQRPQGPPQGGPGGPIPPRMNGPGPRSGPPPDHMRGGPPPDQMRGGPPPPGTAAAAAAAAAKVLSKEEFYRTKKILQKEEKRPGSKGDIYDEFAKDLEKKERRREKKKRDAYDDFMQGIEKRDRETQERKDIEKHVKEEQAKLHSTGNKENDPSDAASVKSREHLSRSRSKTPLSRRSLSPSKRGTPRKNSRTPLRNRSFSRSPSPSLRRRSFSRKRSYSRTPPPRKRSYSRSITPRKRSRTPLRKRSRSFSRNRSISPRKRSLSPRGRKRSLTPRKRSWTPRKRSLSPRKRSLTPRKRSLTPRKRSLTPRKRSLSPRKRSLSPRKRSLSPRKRSLTPRKRSLTPRKRSLSPRKRSLTPRKRSLSPRKRSRSPGKRSLTPRKRSRTPNKRSLSRSPRRNRPLPSKGRPYSRSPGRKSSSRTPIRNRSFSRSPGRRSKSPFRKRSRTPIKGKRKSFSRSPKRKRSFSRTPPPMKRSRTPKRGKSPKRKRSFSRTPPRKLSRSPRRLSPPRKKKSYSRTPPPPRRRSRSYSPGWKDDYKRSRSRSPWRKRRSPPRFRGRNRKYRRSPSPYNRKRTPSPYSGPPEVWPMAQQAQHGAYMGGYSTHQAGAENYYNDGSGGHGSYPIQGDARGYPAQANRGYQAHDNSAYNRGYQQNPAHGFGNQADTRRGYPSQADSSYPVHPGVPPAGGPTAGYGRHPPPPGTEDDYMQRFARNEPSAEDMRRLPPEWIQWYQQLHEYRQRLNVYAATKGLPPLDETGRTTARPAKKADPTAGSMSPRDDLAEDDPRRRGRSRSRSQGKRRGKKDSRGYESRDRKHDRGDNREKHDREREKHDKDSDRHDRTEREKDRRGEAKHEKEKEKEHKHDKDDEENVDHIKEGKSAEKVGKSKDKHKKKEKKEKKEKSKKEKKKRKNRESKDDLKAEKSTEKHKNGDASDDEDTQEEIADKKETVKQETEVPSIQVNVAHEDTANDNLVGVKPEKPNHDEEEAESNPKQSFNGVTEEHRNQHKETEIKAEDIFDDAPTYSSKKDESQSELESHTKKKQYKNKNIWSNRDRIKSLADYDSGSSVTSPKKKAGDSPVRKAVDYKDAMSPTETVELELHSTSELLSPTKSISSVISPLKQKDLNENSKSRKDDRLVIEKHEKKVLEDSRVVQKATVEDVETSIKKESIPVHSVVASVVHKRNSDDVLVKLPELSKWERESDSDTDEDRKYMERKERKKEQKKMMLPRSVIESAANAIASKPRVGAMNPVSTSATTTTTAAKVGRRVFLDDKNSDIRKVKNSSTSLMMTINTAVPTKPLSIKDRLGKKVDSTSILPTSKRDELEKNEKRTAVPSVKERTVVPSVKERTTAPSVKDRLGSKDKRSSSRDKDKDRAVSSNKEKDRGITSSKDKDRDVSSSKDKDHGLSSSSGGRRTIKLNRDFSREGRESSRRDSGRERDSRDSRRGVRNSLDGPSDSKKESSDDRREHSSSSKSKSYHYEKSSGQSSKSKDKSSSKNESSSSSKSRASKLDRKISVVDESVFEPDYHDYDDDDDDLVDSGKRASKKEMSTESSDSSDDSRSRSRSPSAGKKRARSDSPSDDKKKKKLKTKAHKKHKKHKKNKEKERDR